MGLGLPLPGIEKTSKTDVREQNFTVREQILKGNIYMRQRAKNSSTIRTLT